MVNKIINKESISTILLQELTLPVSIMDLLPTDQDLIQHIDQELLIFQEAQHIDLEIFHIYQGDQPIDQEQLLLLFQQIDHHLELEAQHILI